MEAESEVSEGNVSTGVTGERLEDLGKEGGMKRPRVHND